MLNWQVIAVTYFSYLAAASLLRNCYRRARLPSLAAAAAGWILFTICSWQNERGIHFGPIALSLVPLPVLLTGYWISGIFFIHPMHSVENWLMRTDAKLLNRSGIFVFYCKAPRLFRDYFELAYLLVYAVVPAGALVLVVGGHAHAIGYFWAAVLLAAFASYSVLPWVQTRPPRALGGDADLPRTALRRLNLAILNHGSIQVNTIPSGHAACAVAAALAVCGSMPIAGAAFVVLAASITAATVFGRYHYTVDSMLGVLVGLCAWGLLNALA